MTLGRDLLADLIPSRTRIDLSVGPAAGFDVPGLLAARPLPLRLRRADREPRPAAALRQYRRAHRLGIAGDAEAKAAHR